MNTNINKLSDIEFKNPFTVPENYFESISEEIMDRLPEKKVPDPIKVSMWERVKPWIYMAAMFIGLYFSFQFIIEKTSLGQNSTSQSLTSNKYVTNDSYWTNVQVSEDEFYEYIEDQLVNDGYYDYMYNQVSY